MSRTGKIVATGVVILVLLALEIYFLDWNLARVRNDRVVAHHSSVVTRR